MSTASLRAFLDGLGLGEYFDALAAERVEPADIPLLTDEDLAALGLPLGPRRRLMQAARLSAAPASPGEGERRNLTVLFCDMVGSTAIAGRIDPEDLRALFRAYREACTAAIEAEGGFVAKSLGDGLMAHFGYPRALEDAAVRAVRAGLELVDRVRRIRIAGGPVEARVGIASGLTVVGDASDTIGGDEMATGTTLALASRLQALAPPGGVVLSDSTRLLLRGAFELQSLGRESLKGFPGPVAVWQATGEARPPSRFDAARESGSDALLGRDAERAALLSRWQDSLRGTGAAVVVVGEAGIGKSRLLAELREAAPPRGDAVLLQCSPYRQSTAFHPVTGWIEAAIGSASDAERETRRARLARMPGTSADALPLLTGVMGLGAEGTERSERPPDPLARQAAILDSMARLLSYAPPDGARMVLVEDVHWADSATLDLIDRLAERTRDAPLLLVVTARPDAARLPATPGVHRIALERLPGGATEALIAAQPGARTLAASLRRTIAERSGGVPLFVEELTRSLLETPDADSAVVPLTLQDTLMARLDRLAAGKAVAQLGALIGRSFSGALLEACSDLPVARLRTGIAELVEAGLVEPQHASDPAYAFRHALVRDAAYGSLLRSRRTELHRRVAETLETRFPALAESQPDVVAHHYTEAGDLAAAVPRWVMAAEHAIAHAAPASAISHFKTALDLLMRLPASAARDEEETALRIRLNMPLTVTTGFASAETEANLSRMAELFEVTAPGEAALQLLWSRCMSALVRADLETARMTALRMKRAAARSDLPNAWRMPERMLGYVAMLEGELEAAEAHFGAALQNYEPDGLDPIMPGHPYDVLAASLSQRAVVMALRGRPADVDRDQASALARARLVGSSATLFQVLVHSCIARFELGDHDAVLPLLGELREVVDREELRSQHADLWEGWLEARQGALDAGLARMSRALQASMRYPLWMPSTVMLRARLLLDAGRHEEALATLDACEADIRRLRHTYLLAELGRLRAASLAATGAPAAQVGALLLDAIAVASRQGARRFELAARLDLARLHLAGGDRKAAAEILLPARSVEEACRSLSEYSEARKLLAGLRTASPDRGSSSGHGKAADGRTRPAWLPASTNEVD